jgi:hypothetical protein
LTLYIVERIPEADIVFPKAVNDGGEKATCCEPQSMIVSVNIIGPFHRNGYKVEVYSEDQVTLINRSPY